MKHLTGRMSSTHGDSGKGHAPRFVPASGSSVTEIANRSQGEHQ